MNAAVYRALYERLSVGEGSTTLVVLAQEPLFAGVPYDTIVAIYRQKCQEHMRKTMWQHRTEWPRYYRDFAATYRQSSEHTAMVELAFRTRIAPCILARNLLRLHLQAAGADEADVGGLVGDYLKQPSLIQDEALRAEIEECIVADDVYSPHMDRHRHYVGLEYEYALKAMLDNMRIPFLDENRMRDLGYSKTPDVRLQVPVAVGNRVVNWIESKASFGDHYLHNKYLEEQYWPYQNRFGPGMVIYWFGFVDDLRDLTDGVLIVDSFPANAVVLRPA